MSTARPLPGSVAVPGREFLYLEWSGPGAFEEVFPLLLAGGATEGPASGGMLNEAAVVTTPAGTSYHGVSYRGDLARFRAGLIAWCRAGNRTWAEVDGGMLRGSDGTVVALDRCAVALP